MEDKVSILRSKICEAGITQEGLAKELGINQSTFYRKIKSGLGSFSVGEAQKMIDVLHLSTDDANHIFLSKDSHDCEFVSTVDTDKYQMR